MITSYLKKKESTLLCSGPMSKNCIDATIELSNQFNIPQVLIASRRQIDAQELGGGYVNNFTTETFSEYVKQKKAPYVYLARDHGGPWQGTYEQKEDLCEKKSLEIAKKSFEQDILYGFDFIHIDPSIPIQNEDLSDTKILNRLFELYGHTFEFAQINNKNIKFELGTEEQNGYGQNLERFEYFLQKTTSFCIKNKIKKPTFVVAQTGTKVMEMKNVGVFQNENIIDNKNIISHISNTIKICKKYDVFLKEHNTDYLNTQALSLRPILGISASNVAPEFGVVETKALLFLLQSFGYHHEFNLFLETALASGKWKKWMLNNSQSTDIDKAIICGHYIFSNEIIQDMKHHIEQKLLTRDIVLDEYLKTFIKQSMLKYLQLFRVI